MKRRLTIRWWWIGLLLLHGAICGAPAASLSAVEPCRLADGTLVFKVSFEGLPEPERVRILLDVDGPVNGELVTGADYMVEGGLFHRYPRRATGWTWDVLEPVVMLVEGAQATFILPPVPLPERGAWSVELISSDFEVESRWPESGMAAAKFADWPLFRWQTPLQSEPLDELSRLLPDPLSRRWGKIIGLTEQPWVPDDKAPGPGLVLGGPVPLKLMLTDAISGRKAVLQPAGVAVFSNQTRWSGTALGVDWMVVAESASPRELLVTGALQSQCDRCLQLAVGMERSLAGGVWLDDIRFSRDITETGGVYSTAMDIPFGLGRRQSELPLAVIALPEGALTAETAPDEPRVYEIVADPAGSFFGIRYEMALTAKTSNFPGRAFFQSSFRVLAGNPENYWRGALNGFYSRHPAYAVRQIPSCAFGRPLKNDSLELACDPDSLLQPSGASVMTLLFEEPWTYYGASTKPGRDEANEPSPPRREAAQRMLHWLSAGSGPDAERASAALTGGARRPDGSLDWIESGRAWHTGLALRVSMLPGLPTSPEAPLNPAMVTWRHAVATNAPHGVFLAEDWNTGRLNYHPAAVAAALYPAAYQTPDGRPGLVDALDACAVVSALSKKLKEQGRFLGGFLTPLNQAFLAAYYDLLAARVVPWPGHGCDPALEGPANRLRMLAGTRPVMVGRVDTASAMDPASARSFLEWCLFRAFMPAFFDRGRGSDSWWEQACTNEGHRILLQTYLPLIRRLAGAGWRPEGLAQVEPASLWCENYGSIRQPFGQVTIRNTSDERTFGHLKLPPSAARGRPVGVLNPLTGECRLIPVPEEGPLACPLGMMPWEIGVRDWFSWAAVEKELAFLQEWSGGGRAAEMAQKNIGAIQQDLGWDLVANVQGPLPAVRGDANQARLEFTNKGTEPVRISGVKAISGSVYRPLEDVSTNLLPGASAILALEFEAEDIQADPWLEIQWETARAGETRVSSRWIRPRVQDPLAVLPLSRTVEGQGDTAYIEVRVRSYSNRARLLVAEWQGDFKPGRLEKNAEPGGTTVLKLPVRRSKARAGEVLVHIMSEKQTVFRQWFDVVLR